MPIYIIVGDTYGMTCIYWTTENEAIQYKRALEQKHPSEHWRVVTFSPPLRVKD